MSDPTVDDLRVAPGSPWSGVCAVCGKPKVEVLCGGCRAGLHYGCGDEHRRTCASLAGRLVPVHGMKPFEALQTARALLRDDPPAPNLKPGDTP